MAGTGGNRRLRRSRSLWCAGIALVSSLAVAGTSYAAVPTTTAATSVCGGFAADAHFFTDLSSLGREHACEHLRLEHAEHDHTSLVSRVGQVVQNEVTFASAAARVAVTDPAKIGRWSTPRIPRDAATAAPTAAVGITSIMLRTGKVLLLGAQGNPGGPTPGYIYDPSTGTGHDILAPAPVFCGSATPLSDGRILFVGGAAPVPKGIVDIWLFDPATETWTRQPDTVKGRYYPTSTRLADGRVVITAGNELDGATRNPDVEVYTPPAAGTDVGQLEVVGPPHPTSMYPHQMVMPNGRMLQVTLGGAYLLDPTTWNWSKLPRMAARAGGGSAHLMLPGGPSGSQRVLVVGGLVAKVAQRTSQTFDLAHRAAGWRLGPSMPTARSHMNLVQVPDGSAYGIGGNGADLRERPWFRTMHYNPDTGRWKNLAVQTVRRAYHSTAVLLPDGRIMSAGDNETGGGLQQIDFYKPPYLFQGKRPVISAAAKRVQYGQRFAIRTTGPTATRAVLMAPGATTHANEMNARYVPLAVTRTARGLSAVAPRTASIAPPGHYMLFVLDAKGVPSVAKWVRVGS
jgi:hypothetical protein